MTEDTYKTITEVSEGTYTEKRSKFIAIALPVRTLKEIKVVRYFGGIKLGTSGLIVAYKAAAAEAIAACTIVEKTVDEEVTVLFEYPFMNDVMRIVKEEEPEILSQSYDMDCSMTLRIRQSAMPRLRSRLEKVETARIADEQEGNG